MHKYYLQVLGSTGVVLRPDVIAEYFTTTTNSSTSSGYYAFFANKELVATYPIERTIIEKVERNYED